MFMKEKFKTGKAWTVPFVSTVEWRSSLVTVSSFLYAINSSLGSTIWKINTSNANEGRLSSRHNSNSNNSRTVIRIAFFI